MNTLLLIFNLYLLILKKLMSTLLYPFIVGGSIIAGAKWASLYLNPGLAAVIGGAPLGLITMLFIAPEQQHYYMYNYIYVILILILAAFLYYLLLTRTNFDNTLVFIIVILFWIFAQLVNQYRIGNLHTLS